MAHDDETLTSCGGHTRESTLNALQVAAEVHEACPACTGTAALYLAALTGLHELAETREGFLQMAREVWDDAVAQAPEEAAEMPPVGALDIN